MEKKIYKVRVRVFADFMLTVESSCASQAALFAQAAIRKGTAPDTINVRSAHCYPGDAKPVWEKGDNGTAQ
jgi:hypothetical protein